MEEWTYDHHVDTTKDETNAHSGHRLEDDSSLGQPGVDTPVQDGSEDDLDKEEVLSKREGATQVKT